MEKLDRTYSDLIRFRKCKYFNIARKEGKYHMKN